MRIERSEDRLAIRSVIGDESVKPFVIEGDEIPVPIHPSIYYFLLYAEHHAEGAVEDIPAGVVSYVPVNSCTWTPHIAIRAPWRGNGRFLLTESMAWMAANTPCCKFFAAPPEFSLAVIKLFEKCGFRREGYSPASFAWQGDLHGRILFGKEAVCGRQ